MSSNIDETCLIIRNFPISFSENDIREFLRMFDPSDLEVFTNYQTAFAVFDSKEHTKNILTLLHQEVIDGSRLYVEYSVKNRNRMSLLNLNGSNTKNQPNDEVNIGTDNDAEINSTLKRLYATVDNLNFNQPPAPYLYYEYPKVNRDIIDSICIALESLPKFYTQVLHLMNRMNLDPPFMPGDKNLIYENSKIIFKSIATQTDEIVWQNLIRNKRKHIESDESELQTSSNEESTDEMKEMQSKSKRKKYNQQPTATARSELSKQKHRNVLKMQRVQKDHQSNERFDATTESAISDAFDFDQNQLKKFSNIKIVVPEKLEIPSSLSNEEITTSNVTAIKGTSHEEQPKNQSDVMSDTEIHENRIPNEQLQEHPLFQNYNAGMISNRLYIKNIAKDVTELDLRRIYERYLESNCNGHGNIRSIDIRLMTTGRMKGQAFIAFDGPYLNCDVDDEIANNLANKYQMIVKALQETNGLIVRGKPLIVVYGKKK